ncbi:T6SS amidase immunity protein Tai4 family protein [Marinobacter sp. ANT_B65]|uniref:T6SS amidase immunity protein Tai4 family protein n=1 Tax=Marinobacter sp. ANT_B65 TaxID=2039467 RepID=UPI000BBF0758|nr:T6SS amidase immunity protein Tai4 family protein [Marinobacter sp. ANT_B65]PCM44830.1 type VI secretion protein [Marinobacter sp. ANT_B65]
MKKALLLCAVFAQNACASADRPSTPTYPPETIFKNYALSTCLADAFEDAELRKDASATAAGFLEFGTGPIEAYTEATLMGREFLKKKYHGKAPVEFNTKKCIDFYHSEELDRLVERYITN